MGAQARDPLLLGATGNRRYPLFFPSVSSLKTNLRPIEYVRLLKALRYPRFLVSAYDLAATAGSEREEVLRLLFEARGRGASVLLDSGNYESYWRADSSWSQEQYHQQLQAGVADVAFSFDQQGVPDDTAAAVEAVTKFFFGDIAVTSSAMIPVVHGSVGILPQACAAVVRSLQPNAIAVPERELGSGLIERFKTLVAIRGAIGSAGSVRIHLLGTGNPLSMLLYTLGGADSFDGLEWCQTVVDHESGLLHHFAHYPLFQHQTMYGHVEDLSPTARALAHNLSFFARWEQGLAAAREENRVRELVASRAPRTLEVLRAT